MARLSINIADVDLQESLDAFVLANPIPKDNLGVPMYTKQIWATMQLSKFFNDAIDRGRVILNIQNNPRPPRRDLAT